MVKKPHKLTKKLKEKSNSEKNVTKRRQSKKFKTPKHLVNHRASLIKENYIENDGFNEHYDIKECINGIKLLDKFISESNKEMSFIKLPFHVNLIRKRNSGYTKYTKIYRKRMLKLIGFGNRFGPHYHKDENGHIYSMEYTDRITSKSLIFFRCQLKGCRAKGVLNSITKKFIVSQKHALSYESHIPNKKSGIKLLIEKTFAEKSYIKDIQIIFCRYYEDIINKQKFNSDLNLYKEINNNDINNIKKTKNLLNQEYYKDNISFSEEKDEKIKNVKNIRSGNQIKDILIKREISRGEIFWNYYNNKFKLGENKYDEYINKIKLANMENERETKEYYLEVEINMNDFQNNRESQINLANNKILGNRYHKDINKEIYLYAIDKFDNDNKDIIFLCKYEGCTGKSYYNFKTKKFTIVVPHLFSYQEHFNNLYQQIDNYKKVMKIFDTFPELTDVQFIYIKK